MNLKKRLVIILYILSVTISVFILFEAVDKQDIVIEYTAFSNYVESEGEVFFSQNIKGQSLLFDIASNGNVRRMFSTKDFAGESIAAVSANGEYIYIVLKNYIENATDQGFTSDTVYRIVCLDRKFKVKSQTNRFIVDNEEVLSGFSAEHTGLFLTMLKNDGSYVKVYCIDTGALAEPNNLTGDEIRVDSVRSKRAEEDKFFVQARYEYGQLYTRTDKDEPTGVFEISETVERAVSSMRLTFGQFMTLYSQLLIWYAAGLVAWLIVLSLILRILTEKNRMFYLAVIVEATLAIITAVGINSVISQWEQARQTEHSRFAVISMMGLADDADVSSVKNYGSVSFYESDSYKNIKQHIVKFIRQKGNEDIFYDVLIVRLADNMVMASASGRNLQSLTSVYGDDCLNLDYSIYRGNRYAVQDLVLEGQHYRAVAIADGNGATNYSLVGIINDTTTDADVFVDNRATLILFVLFFALGSALVMAVCYLQTKDFKQLEIALSDTALGRKINNRPAVVSRDLKEMWDAIVEINKRVEELQYSKLRILEAYYRFAPKNIEKLLSRNSIIEVKNGENTMLYGTLAMLGIDSKHSYELAKLDSVIADIGRFQKQHDTILVGKAPDMTRMQLMFMEHERSTVEFFVQMFNHNLKSGEIVNFSTVLFYDQCRFGILGSEDEASAYLHCRNQSTLVEMTSFITDLELGLIITEEVKNRETIEGPVRFIGYMAKERTGEMIRLYEVLDAYPVVVRNQKLATLNKFQEALNQYYEKDFYLSRTSFSEILKDTPNDLLVKWYVFESDRYLNENVVDNEYMCLKNRT